MKNEKEHLDFEPVGTYVRTRRTDEEMGGTLVAEVSMLRVDRHELVQLFAAAPDLLRALEKIAAEHDALTPGECAWIARAAIAKAKGVR